MEAQSCDCPTALAQKLAPASTRLVTNPHRIWRRRYSGGIDNFSASAVASSTSVTALVLFNAHAAISLERSWTEPGTGRQDGKRTRLREPFEAFSA